MGCRPGANSGFSSYVNTLKPIPPIVIWWFSVGR